MQRREFLQVTAAAAVFPTLPAPARTVRRANTYPSGPGGHHGVNKESGLHIESIGWIPNIPWHYVRIPAGNGYPAMLKLKFAAKRTTSMLLWGDLQDWAAPTPFKRADGRQDYITQGRIVTLWDFKRNRQECVEDVYPVALQATYGREWSHLEMDLFHGNVVERLNEDDFLYFVHMTETPN